MQLIKGETVTVIAPNEEYDRFGEPVDSDPVETDVLCVVCPGATTDFDATRPDGIDVAYTVHFPKTWTDSLRGCKVRVRGREYEVVGDPQAYTTANTPGLYNRPCEVKYADG